MLSRQLLELMTTGAVEFKNEVKHHIEVRRLPPRADFTEEELEKVDNAWLDDNLSINYIKTIQNYKADSRFTSSGSTWKPNKWLLAMLYFATLANGGRAEGEAVCMEVSQSAPTIQVQSMLMSVMMLVIFALAFFIYKVKLSLARLKGIVDTEMIQVLDPMNQRLRDAERDQRNHIYNFDALQRQV